jgi:glycosyltransferase involved in cell wall biosynthesis
VRITVVIPAHNASAFLAKALKSLLAQHYPVSEILLVDDGSTDATAAVVRSFGDRVRYVYQEQAGVSRARNTGIRLATCPWIAFLDADDWWLPGKLASQVAALEKEPGAVLAYTGILWVYGDGESTAVKALRADQMWPALRYRNPLSTSSVLVRRDALLEQGGFPVTISHCEDWDLWVRLRLRYPFVAVEEPLTAYRMTPGSLSGDMDKMLSGTAQIIEGTLLAGIGWHRRWFWRRRIWSAQLFVASISAREAGQPRVLQLLSRSILQWPIPHFMPERWLELAQEILGRKRYAVISRRIKPWFKQTLMELQDR